MSARRIDGKAVAAELRAGVAQRAAQLAAQGRRPGLAVVLVGDDLASQVYVASKDKAAHEAGFLVRTLRLASNTTQKELLRVVRELNQDDAIHGILVQLPLPKGLDEGEVVRALDPRKDVDGLHPHNVAALWMGAPGLFPCTPCGCMELIRRECAELSGLRALVIGRSQLVGKPLAGLLLAANASITVGHSRSRDLPGLAREAEVLVVAVGRPEMVRGDWIRPGAIVIDVGMNRLPSGKLVGDVCTAEAAERAAAITPVPGGVGPMTIAMLLANTATAAERSLASMPARSQ